MTEDEWESCHPMQAQAYVKAWTDKQKREAHRLADLELTIATGAGMKKRGGGKLTIDDFLPAFAKSKKKLTPEESEAKLKAALIHLAKQSNGEVA